MRPEDLDAGGMETVYPWRESDGDGTTVESEHHLVEISMGVRNPVMLIRLRPGDMAKVVKPHEYLMYPGRFFGRDDGKANRQSQLRANETADHGVTDFGLFLHLHPCSHDPCATTLRQHNALTLRRIGLRRHRDNQLCLGARTSRSLSSRVCLRLTGSSTGGLSPCGRRQTTNPLPTVRMPVTSARDTR